MTPYYQRDGVTLYCGDSREIMPQLDSVDALITDPPYGISHSSSKGASWQNTEIAGDSDTSVRDEVIGGFPVVAAFGTWKTEPITDTRGVLVWDKGPASGMGDLSFPWKPSWELIYIRGDRWRGHRDEGVIRGHTVVTWESKGRKHPHAKPVTLIVALLDKLPSARLICDPFMGSGPTAIACIRTGRQFIGIELTEHYCEVAAERCDRELDQGNLFPFASEPTETQRDLFQVSADQT